MFRDILKDFHDKKELQFNLCDFSDSPEIDINVNTTSRGILQLKASPSYPIGNIKHLVTNEKGIKEELQVFMRFAKPLANDLTLNDLNIKQGDYLQCIFFMHF